MATRFPLQINNIRFSVNPTGLSIAKPLTFGTLATQGGVKFHVWYDTPEVLTISGLSAGKTAYKELLFLKQTYERTNKVSELFYKTRVYRGFITELTVDASTDHLNTFNYTIKFQLVFGEQFAIEDFALNGQESTFLSNQIARLANRIDAKIKGFERSIEKRINNIF